MAAARGEYLRLEPQMEMRVASLRESVWRRIGDLRLAMNDTDGALEAFDTVLQSNPRNMGTRSQIGAALAKKGLFYEAIQHLERVDYNENDPTCQDVKSDDVCSLLAHCYVMTHQLDRAYSAYSHALSLVKNPKDPSLWYGIGLLYDRCGSVENALEAFQAVLNIDPNFHRSDEVCFCIGVIYKEQGKLDESLAYFRRTMTSGPPPHPLTYADSLYQIAHVNELKKDYAVAIETYKKALEHNPRHHRSLQQLGWIQHVIGNNVEAIDMLTRATEVSVNDGQAFYLLGRVYMATQEFRKAYDAYQEAVRCDHNNSTYWCSIGVLYYQMQQHSDALDAYTRAIRLNPAVSASWYDLGTLFESCSQPDDAMVAYRRASRISPRSQQITQRLEKLEQQQPVQQPTMLQHPPAPGQDIGTQSPAIILPEGRRTPKLPHIMELFRQGILPGEDESPRGEPPSIRVQPTYAPPVAAPQQRDAEPVYGGTEEVVTVSRKVGPSGVVIPETTKMIEYPPNRPIQVPGMDDRFPGPIRTQRMPYSGAPPQRPSQPLPEPTRPSTLPPRPTETVRERPFDPSYEADKFRARHVTPSTERGQAQLQGTVPELATNQPAMPRNRAEEYPIGKEVSAEMLPKLPSLPPMKAEAPSATQQKEYLDQQPQDIPAVRPELEGTKTVTGSDGMNTTLRLRDESNTGAITSGIGSREISDKDTRPEPSDIISKEKESLNEPVDAGADQVTSGHPSRHSPPISQPPRDASGELMEAERREPFKLSNENVEELKQTPVAEESGKGISKVVARNGDEEVAQKLENEKLDPHTGPSTTRESVLKEKDSERPNGAVSDIEGHEEAKKHKEDEGDAGERHFDLGEEGAASKTPHHVETEDESVSAEEGEAGDANVEDEGKDVDVNAVRAEKAVSPKAGDSKQPQPRSSLSTTTGKEAKGDDDVATSELGQKRDITTRSSLEGRESAKEDNGAGTPKETTSTAAQGSDEEAPKAKSPKTADSKVQSKKSPPILSLPLSRPPRRIPTNKLAGLGIEPGMAIGIGSPSTLTKRGSPMSDSGYRESPKRARPTTPNFRSTPAPKISPGLPPLRSSPQVESKPVQPLERDGIPKSCGEKRGLREEPDDGNERRDSKKMKATETDENPSTSKDSAPGPSFPAAGASGTKEATRSEHDPVNQDDGKSGESGETQSAVEDSAKEGEKVDAAVSVDKVEGDVRPASSDEQIQDKKERDSLPKMGEGVKADDHSPERVGTTEGHDAAE
eukprot:Plantae.Rhodophyta-Hildenbrandia_rubra.ctg1477.p1 GENE.Plantae.Rhodophyta-Hildenbrandia_rubra.ctg1477~~Plantae.Rhodophyta-Hildenbrandia_rubra.ctg1477.p1  ORF type:complete len:1253 (+),score=247.27 Plantae.Rhodophyta-Hildenbrandia_rubra.ctg1477:1539-5297(+)